MLDKALRSQVASPAPLHLADSWKPGCFFFSGIGVRFSLVFQSEGVKNGKGSPVIVTKDSRT